MRIAIVCSLLLVASTSPSRDAAAQFAEKKVLTLDIARKMVAAAESEAARNHLAGVVAVVDDGGWLILLERMDHAAFLASVELAPGKARTAALFKKPSQALEDAINHGRVAAVTAQGFTEMQGGLPIVADGEVVGAIGASFDTPEHDVQIAQAGLAALEHLAVRAAEGPHRRDPCWGDGAVRRCFKRSTPRQTRRECAWNTRGPRPR
jgi:glc operon protein GlcG